MMSILLCSSSNSDSRTLTNDNYQYGLRLCSKEKLFKSEQTEKKPQNLVLVIGYNREENRNKIK